MGVDSVRSQWSAKIFDWALCRHSCVLRSCCRDLMHRTVMRWAMLRVLRYGLYSKYVPKYVKAWVIKIVESGSRCTFHDLHNCLSLLSTMLSNCFSAEIFPAIVNVAWPPVYCTLCEESIGVVTVLSLLDWSPRSINTTKFQKKLLCFF